MIICFMLNFYLSLLMYSKIRDEKEKFDVIDLDPYGTAVPFLDAAMQSISDGGIFFEFYFCLLIH